MTLAPLLDAPPVIRLHAAFAFAAIGLGAVQLLAPKGTLPHRTIGWAWAVITILVAGTSFFIHSIRTWGPWSPIHLLSLFTLGVVPLAVLQARQHNVKAHRSAMIWIFTLALVVTGLFTLAPGRIMNKVVFGG
ncbi:MAG TPA: DUF2306 domain-containing protein [Roseiarcus sp.]